MVHSAPKVPQAEGSYLSYLSNLLGSPSDPAKVEAVEKKGISELFFQFSDMQRELVEKQPLTAAVYILAGFFFGFVSMFSFNPFSIVRAGLISFFAAALIDNVYRTEGFMSFIGRVKAEFSAYTSNAKPSRKEEDGSTKKYQI